MLDNKEIGVDKALLLFVLASTQSLDSDLYFHLRPEPSTNVTLEPNPVTLLKKQLSFVKLGTSGLIFYLDRSTSVR